ncbi:MAG: CoA transferase [Acetobacteraceae bacterium]|nr:CoA transferase [Acetobacteraceae bacterium]
MTPAEIAADLCARVGLADAAPLAVTGTEPILPSSFRVDAAAAATIGAVALAAEAIWRARTAKAGASAGQGVSIDLRHAAAEFRSERWLRIGDEPPRDPWDPIAGAYPTRDGPADLGWVRLHTNFPHHRDGILKLLACEPTREAVAAALRPRRAEDFETEAWHAGMCVSAYRSFAQWDAHPHAQALAGLPPLRLERLRDAPPRPFTPNPTRPLAGLRVLDLTRVIAGPVATRALAAHGAEVLTVASPTIPNLPTLIADTGRGKRACAIDLETETGRAALRALVEGADIFVQSYRPGALARHGFGPAQVAAMRPGIIVATLSAYGESGPHGAESWAGKRGFDSLVQTATGFNHAEAEAAGTTTPKPLPCQALDHASGYLLALAALAARLRQSREGGSWKVSVSLATTGNWLRSLGRIDGLATPDPTFDSITDLLEPSTFGPAPTRALRHAASLSETPPHWSRGASPLGSDPASW